MEVLKKKINKLNAMKKIVQSLYILCLLFLLNACTKDADVKLPAVASKLVINSFLSPQDSLVKVTVTLSQPLYNNSNSGQYYNVSDATVQINDGSVTKTLLYNSVTNYYYIPFSQLPIIVGTTYYLTVTTPDGKNVSASTSIPNANSTLTFSSQIINDPNQGNQYSITANWNDTPGSEDYYRISYYSKQFYPGAIDTTYYSSFSDNFSDKDYDGKIFNQNFSVYESSITGSEGELYLIHATKEYYLFHLKLADAAGSGNPFSEPVQMYSNINGGYGIFAGFNQYKLQVSL